MSEPTPPYDPPWMNGPPDAEECEAHAGEPRPCRLCRMEEDERRADEQRELRFIDESGPFTKEMWDKLKEGR